MTWDDVDRAVEKALREGWLADYRKRLPTNPTKRFRSRKSPADVLGCCTHQSASRNQDPRNTAAYHSGPNHVSATGCPGLLYTLAISQDIEPGKVLLCNDLRSETWSQGKAPTAEHPEWSGDENRHLVSILMMGDFDEPATGHRGKSGDPTSLQIKRWKKATNWLRALFGFDGLGYFGHYHFGKGACPGRVGRQLVECRRLGYEGLQGDREWQEALLRWDPECLPEYGADGDWGNESKRALVAFERAHKHRADGIQDPFTELLLLRKYPAS
jgi:hypothetical protein